MIDIRYGTAQTITVGPFYDATDGKTPETALTATNEHCTMIAGTTLVIDADLTAADGDNDFVHITNDDAGYYTLELTVAQTSYLGTGKLSINYVTDHIPSFHELNFMSQEAYDLKYGARKEPGVMFTTTIDTVTSQTELLLTDGPTDDDSCNNMLAKIIDQSDPDQIDVVPISDYSGGPSVIEMILLREPLFTVAPGDTVVILITEAGIMSQPSDIWAELTSGLTTVGSIGKLIVDFLDAAITSRLASAGYTAPDNSSISTILSRIIGTIATGTHNPQSGDGYAILSNGTYGNSALQTLLTTIAGYLDTEIQAIIDALATAQSDLDKITGSDGATLATAQGNYAPAKAGDEMDLVNAPNSTAIAALQDGLATLEKLKKYIQLLSRSDAAIETDNATELGEINNDEGSGAGNFSSQTDSQEAIRDEGDAAWVTGGGGAAPTVQEIRTEMDDNSTKLASILEDVTGIDGDAMRGTDGANTVIPDAAGAAAAIISAIASLNNISESDIQDMTYGDGTLKFSDLLTILSGIFGGAMTVDLDDTETGTITFYNQADEAVLTATFTNGSRAKPVWNKVT
jgi:hypothetical protein